MIFASCARERANDGRLNILSTNASSFGYAAPFTVQPAYLKFANPVTTEMSARVSRSPPRHPDSGKHRSIKENSAGTDVYAVRTLVSAPPASPLPRGAPP